MKPSPLKLVPPTSPAPTSASQLANLAQMLKGYLATPPELDRATYGEVGKVLIPRAHLVRMLELVHEIAFRLDPPLAAARGLVLWLLAFGIFGAGVLVGLAL